MKKAQEKFDELKKNAQMQGETKAEFVENSNEIYRRIKELLED